MLPGGGCAGENDAGGAIGDLAAVLLAHPPLDNRVEFVIATEGALGKLPLAGLGASVVPGIAEVDPGDGVEVLAVDAVALVVLAGDAIEQEGPGEIAVSGFPALPGRRAQVLRAGFAVDIAHQFQPEDAGDVVMPGLDIAHGREDGDGARGAGRLVAGGGQRGQFREHMAEKAADQALAREQLRDEVAHVAHLDLRRLDAGIAHRFTQSLGEHVVQAQPLPRPVAGEVGLAAPEDVDIG